MGDMPQGRLGPQGIARDHLQGIADKMPPSRGPDELGLKQQHDVARATYDKVKDSRRMLDHIRVELDKLADMADTVTPQDVIGAAGRLVGHGVPAREMAVLLSDMPQGAGQGLASWIQAHDMLARQQEAEVDRVANISRHRLGVTALKDLAGEHALGRMRGQQVSTPQAAGQLGPQPRPGLGGGMPQTSVMQVAQRPEVEGPGAEEAA